MTTLWSSEGLAGHDFPEPAFLVDPLIPQGGNVLVHGKRGVGKTQFLLTLSYYLNSGHDLFGRWPVRQGPCVIIEPDMTGPLGQLRVQKALQEVDLPNTYWAFPRSVDIFNMDLKDAKLVEEIRAIEPVMVAWDTLRKIHREPENSSETPSRVYDAANSLFPTATHVFPHHDKKSPADPAHEVDPEEQFRGSGAWIDDAETSIQLVDSGGLPRRIRMLTHKARTAPDTEKVPVTLEMDLDTMLLLPTRVRDEGGTHVRASKPAQRRWNTLHPGV